MVTRTDLVMLGVTDHEISERMAGRRLEQVHPGVYYLDAVAATWKTHVLAGVLAAGVDALASHRTAAVLWEFDAVYRGPIEVTVPFSAEPIPHEIILHRTRRALDGVLIDGIPVTPPERTLIDLAGFLPERVLQKAGRSAIHNRITTIEALDAAVGEHGGRGVAGTRRIRRVIRFLADDRSASVAEIDLRHIVDEAAIPRPVQQLQVRMPDGTNAYPDFSWPDRLRIVEVDGFGAHSTPEALQQDLRRQNQLLELGWEIRRFTATEVRDEPDRVRFEIIQFVNRPFCAG